MRIPNYEHGILQVINTIRKEIGVSYYYSSDEDVEKWIKQHQFKQIVVMLIDGMGVHQIEKYCNESGFLKKYLCKCVDTVYPPTTVAATTSVLTGKAPCETGWLSWQQYFSNLDEHVIMFFNCGYYNEKPLNDKLFSYHAFPIVNVVDECMQNKINAKEIFPAFRDGGVESFHELCNRVVDESHTLKNRYIYAYWDGYDSFMHEHGVNNEESISMLREFDEILENTMKNLNKDSGLLIIADHGHIDVKSKYLIDYPDIMECFEHLPAFETRTVNFFIKNNKKDMFLKLFNLYFKDDFYLLTKDEVLEMQLFGKGTVHPEFEKMLGDYIACGKTNIQLVMDSTFDLKGHHAGMSNEEIEIPVILFSNEN